MMSGFATAESADRPYHNDEDDYQLGLVNVNNVVALHNVNANVGVLRGYLANAEKGNDANARAQAQKAAQQAAKDVADLAAKAVDQATQADKAAGRQTMPRLRHAAFRNRALAQPRKLRLQRRPYA